LADLVVAGAGMGGLVAAARARELGASVTVYEKTGRAGGSMLLSGGYVWRYRDFDGFRAECPLGDPELQRLVFERLDHALAWLEALGAPVLERETGNPRTTGRRFDTRGLTDALARRAGDIRLGAPLTALETSTPVVLATGGFPADRALLREHVTAEAEHLLVRAHGGNTGDGIRLALAHGATASAGLDEIYGRNMPAPPARVAPEGFRSLAQLYAAHARVTNAAGEAYEPRTWSEIDVVQWTARQPRARAWYAVPDEALAARVRDRTVGGMVEAARAAGAPVERRGRETVVEVVAGVTTTLGGLRVDGQARAADGIYACGTDVGGISTGGYTSGLAAALVLGLVAAESALEA
jgi:succinate dehydrogenase/fumarate reductase flavoprotein subunit